MEKKTEITVFNTKVKVIRVGENDYFCLTDLARYKNPDRPEVPVQSWMNRKTNFEVIREWEIKHNPDFKHTQEGVFKGYKDYLAEVFINDTGTPSRWINYTNAKGFVVYRGRYGGTYAHSTLALHFANYINAKFYIHVLEEYQVLKQQQALAHGDPHDIKRSLTSGNYSLMVAALFTQMDERLLMNPQPYKSRLPIAAEADMLNEIVFGMTAKEWRQQNADKPSDRNMRDYAAILDLMVLMNLEALDSMLLQWDCDKKERRRICQEAFDFWYPLLKRSKTLKDLKALAGGGRLENG